MIYYDCIGTTLIQKRIWKSLKCGANLKVKLHFFVVLSLNFIPLLSFKDELKDFLCIVQHDRKFFLTETAHVFKQSVLRLDQFSAYKALMGFEAISQYANNLFRKPWRKEYRSIKVK